VGRWQEADINQAKYDKSQRCPAAVCSLSGMIAHLEFEDFEVAGEENHKRVWH